jgi:hypothetical protein
VSTKYQLQSFADGEVRFWIEQDSSIHLIATAPHGDPVELTAADAREIAVALLSAAQQLHASEHPDGN